MREDFIAELDPYVLVLPEKTAHPVPAGAVARRLCPWEAIKAPLTGTGYSFAEGKATSE
jgi:hypothetical protein